MPTMQFETPVAAGATVANAFSGSAFEFMRVNSLVSLGCTASATGCFISITSGSDVILEESPPVVKATPPVIPDEMYYNDFAAPGDRLVLRLRNPTGGPVTFRGIANVQAV